MKTIGIKLADGSFYPVIQEGSTEEVNLSLTTANNNQTKVIVDLYRSKTNSMDDAEYVDSLQIENLNAHPDGEPDLALSVSLDENNQLHAKMVDSETGAQSNSTVTLVSRTLEERLGDTQDNSPSVAAAAAAGAVAGIGLMAAAEAMKDDEPEAPADETFATEENPLEEDLANFDAQIPEEQEAPAFDEEISVDIPEDETPAEETPADDMPDFEESAFDMPAEETPAEPTMDDFKITEEDVPSAFEDVNIPDEEPAATPVANNGSVEQEFSENPLEAFGGESHVTAEDGENLGDFFGNIEDSDETPADETITEETPADEPAADDTIVEEDAGDFDSTELPDMNFDVPETSEEDNQLPPDFFNMEEESFAEDTFTADEPAITDDDFAAPAEDTFNDEDFAPSADTAGDGISDDDFFHINDEEPAPAAGGISFTGLYDKQEAFEEPEDEEEKSKTPVIICVTCAIICLLAVFLLLFILPTKYNLIQKKAKKAPEPVAEAVADEPVVETPKVEPIPAAKEDEVIIIEKAEEVVPLPPPVKEEKPSNITYKIKWGDTLWDISDTYYKNPWRYKYLARFNGIKDPDYIISGTYIIIPAE